MLVKFWNTYKMPLMLSATLVIVLVALRIERSSFQIALIILGVLTGTFVLDLDYIIYAYFLEPQKEFSKSLIAYFKHRDIAGAITYVQYHKQEIKEKTLNSALFQVVLAATTIFVVASSGNIFIKALVLSVFLNSLYRFVENFLENKTEEWFWLLKEVPQKNAVITYGVILLGVFVYCLTAF